MDQDEPTTSSEQMEQNTISPKKRTLPEIDNDDSRETPLPPKKKYEKRNYSAFFSSPV